MYPSNNYGVKVIFRNIAISEPNPDLVDEYFSNKTIFVEEILYLIKASNFEEAYKKAEIEANKQFIDAEIIDGYGRKIQLAGYEIVNAFHMFDNRLKNGTELFSNIFHTTKRKLKNILDEMHPEDDE